MILSLNISRCFRNKIDLEKYTFYSTNNVSNIILVEYLKSLLIFVHRYATIERQQQQRISKLSLEKTWRSSLASGGGDAVVNKGGRCASRGFNPGVGAYFTVCGPISRRQSEPARIHHRVTPRNNFLHHNELLSKPSYLFISPRPLLLSFFRLLCLTTRYFTLRTTLTVTLCNLVVFTFLSRKDLSFVKMPIFIFFSQEKTFE